jgi:hypothetical protein
MSKGPTAFKADDLPVVGGGGVKVTAMLARYDEPVAIRRRHVGCRSPTRSSPSTGHMHRHPLETVAP